MDLSVSIGFVSSYWFLVLIFMASSAKNHFWAIARRLEDTQWVKVRTSDLYVTTAERLYWKFNPRNVSDYVEKCEYATMSTDRKKTKFLHLHYVLYMSGKVCKKHLATGVV